MRVINNKYFYSNNSVTFIRNFDNFLTLCILINAINIANSDYKWRAIPGAIEKQSGPGFILGKIITIIFLIEFVIKVIAMGFCLGKNSYIRDHWNKLDFIVVITG